MKSPNISPSKRFNEWHVFPLRVWTLLKQEKILRSPVVAMVGILVLVTLVYTPFAPQYTFVRDDYSLVKISRDEPFSSLVTSTHYVNLPFAVYWRPLTKLTIKVNYYLAGAAPLTYYLTDVGIHLLAVALVFGLIWKLSRHTGLSALTALIFGVHQGTMVSATWLAARQDALVTVWVTLAVFLFILFLESKRSGKTVVLGSLVLSTEVAGLASKESAVILPGLLVGVYVIYAVQQQALWRWSHLRKAGALLLVSVAILVLYWALRWTLRAMPLTTNFPILVDMNQGHGVVQAVRSTLVYVATLFSPTPLDMWMEMIWYFPLVTLFNSLLILTSFLVSSIALLVWQQRHQPFLLPSWTMRVALFAYAWILITLLPPVSLVFPSRWNVYMPVIGAAALTAATFILVLTLVQEHVRSRMITGAVAMTMVLYIGVQTSQTVWQSTRLAQEGASWTRLVEQVVHDINAQAQDRPTRKAYVAITDSSAILPPRSGFSALLQDAVELYLPSGPKIEVLEFRQCPRSEETICVEIPTSEQRYNTR